MKYLSVCSGIEAATEAWRPLGWSPVLYSEIEDFPRAVLTYRHKARDVRCGHAAKTEGVPLWGDFTALRPRFLRRLGIEPAIDLIVGGTPCQDFSVAGARAGLGGNRGNLTIEFGRLLRRFGPKWFVWENVTGCFSLNSGADFGAVIACFTGHAPGYRFAPPDSGWRAFGVVPPAAPGCYGIAWRVLDTQFTRTQRSPRAAPQRRTRVIVVGYLGDWRPAAAVLLERESLQGHPAPRRDQRQGIASDVAPSLTASGRGVDRCGESRGQDPVVAHTLRAEGFDAREDGTGRGTPIVPVPTNNNTLSYAPAISPALKARDYKRPSSDGDGDGAPIIAFDCKASGRNGFAVGNIAPTIRAMGSKTTNQNGGGHAAIAYPIQEIGKRTGKSTTDPRAGIGIGNEADPTFTLQASAQHGVAVAGTLCRDSFTGGAGGRPEGAAAGHFIPVAYDLRGREGGSQLEGPHHTANIRASSGGATRSFVQSKMAVRRLTPKECERLHAFPDNYTLIPLPRRRRIEFDDAQYLWAQQQPDIKCWCEGGKWYTNAAADGPRYKALGNTMSVNVMEHIGQRIQAVENIIAHTATPANDDTLAEKEDAA